MGNGNETICIAKLLLYHEVSVYGPPVFFTPMFVISQQNGASASL